MWIHLYAGIINFSKHGSIGSWCSIIERWVVEPPTIYTLKEMGVTPILATIYGYSDAPISDVPTYMLHYLNLKVVKVILIVMFNKFIKQIRPLSIYLKLERLHLHRPFCKLKYILIWDLWCLIRHHVNATHLLYFLWDIGKFLQDATIHYIVYI